MNAFKPVMSLLIASAMAAGCVQSTILLSSGERQILDTGEVMKLLMDPIYENLKDAVENPPQKRAEWRSLYVTSYTLAETHNLLYSRTDHGYMLDPEWRDLVTGARAVATALGESVKNRDDYEVIKSRYMALVESCNSCHRRYDPDEEDAPKIDPPRSWMPEDETGVQPVGLF